MSITDELRGFANELDWVDYRADVSARKLRAIADRIDAEYKKALSGAYADKMDANGWVRLPKDADGEIWHPNDTMEAWGAIEYMVLYSNGGWYLKGHDMSAPCLCASECRHYHAHTVEDVLEELLREYDRDDSELTDGEIIEMFAKRLRLAEVEDA